MSAGAGSTPTRDYIGASTDATLQKTLDDFRKDPKNVEALAGFPSSEEEKILFADNMIKINRYGSRQQRSLIITSIAVLNFKPKKYKEFQRRIPIAYIEELWTIAGSNDLVIHMWAVSKEYDYRFDAGSAAKRQEIIDALQDAMTELLDKPLPVRDIDEKGAKSEMILKPQVKDSKAKIADTATASALASRRSLVTTVSATKSSRRILVSEASSTSMPAMSTRTLPVTRPSVAQVAPIAATSSPPLSRASTPSIAAIDGGSVAQTSIPEGPEDAALHELPAATFENGCPALTAVAADICSVSKTAPDNDALAKAVAEYTTYNALGSAILYAEALLNMNAADPIIQTICSGVAKASLYLHGASEGVVYPDDAEARGWCTRALWRLLGTLKSASLLQEDVRAAGGFDGYILRGFGLEGPVTSFDAPVSRALMEVLIDGVTKPSDSATTVETFGRLLARPEHLRLVFRLLPVADWQVKHDVMKDLNVLLIKREDNFPRILDQSDWIAWLAPLLACLPRQPTDRTDLMNEYLKYVINFFTMLLAHTFQGQGADIERTLSRFISQIQLQCGWGDASVNVVRNILASLASKLAQNAKRWNRKYDRPEWDSLFKLATVVEDFIFYRPVSEETTSEIIAEQAAGGIQMMIYVPAKIMQPSSSLALVGSVVNGADRSNPGLHLNIRTGEADDLKLAQRMVNLFQEVGLTGDSAKDPSVAAARDKKSKDMLTHANSIMKVFTEIVSFLDDCNKSKLLDDTSGAGSKTKNDAAESRLLENLAKFLEKRQKQQRTGFMSKSANKKGIVQALQTSVMRQRAQQTIRTQVQATIIAKATTTTIEDVEDDIHGAGNKRGGLAVTAKRLQGTRAAVEQVVGAGAPSAADTTGTGGAGSIADTASGGVGVGGRSGGEMVAAAASEAVKASLSALSVGLDDDHKGEHVASASHSHHTPEDDTRVADIICDRCNQPLLDDDGVGAMGKNFHVNCFCCFACDTPFRDAPFYERKEKPYCRNDFLKLFGRGVCAGCMCPLQRGELATQAAGRMYHQHHFFCEGCGVLMPPEAQFYERDGAPYCSACNLSLFGTCAGCNKQITADRPAVSALNRNWHLTCIKCAYCSGGFGDGVFYTNEDSNGVMQAYCERDYLELFAPRCRECNEPVRDDGMAACSACWHAACFRCTICKKAFPDGAYFEVDGRPYCSNDYYSNFGTQCAGCNSYIVDELVNAIGKSWHPEHFTCGNCNKKFPDMEYYEKDGKAYDEDCYCQLFCPRCPVCDKYVVEEGAVALDSTYHPACLTCCICQEQLTTTVRKGADGRLFCEKDFLSYCAFTCARCNKAIDGDSLSALDKHWHTDCFRCFGEGCDLNLADGDAVFHEIDGLPYCKDHYAELKGEKCCKCGKGVFPTEQLTVMGRPWHPQCLQCHVCSKVLTTADKIYPKNDAPHCEACFMSTADKCVTCGAPILGKYLTVLGRKYHATGCLGCIACKKAFDAGEKMYQRDGWPVCLEHARGELSEEAKARMGAPANAPPPPPSV